MSAPAALFATGGGNGDNGGNNGNGGCDNNNSSSNCEYPKVEICHVPPGNPGNAHTIRVSQSAVPAHLAHGDSLGPCPPDNNNNNNNDNNNNGKHHKKHKGDDRNGKKHRGDDRR